MILWLLLQLVVILRTFLKKYKGVTIKEKLINFIILFIYLFIYLFIFFNNLKNPGKVTKSQQKMKNLACSKTTNRL